MAYKSALKKQTTIDAYVKAYKAYYKDDPIIHEDMAKLPAPILQAWLQKNIDLYSMNYKKFSKFAVVWKQMYQYAIYMGYLDSSPFDKLPADKLRYKNTAKPKSKDKAFSHTETADIYELAMRDFESKPYCVPLAVMLVFQTGIRLGEVVALKWSDIDFEDKTLHICRMEETGQESNADFRDLGKSYHAISELDTKGSYGERYVDLTDDAIYILNLLKDFYDSENLHSEWLFVNKDGRIHNRAMDLRIRKYCRHAGMPKEKSLHKIRSTYISTLRDAGMSFEKIAEQVGHKSVLTTMNNYSFDLKEREENRRILNECLSFRKFKVPQSNHG